MTPEPVDPKVTSWTDAKGRAHAVTTHRDPNESESAWDARHQEAVTFWKIVWPEA